MSKKSGKLSGLERYGFIKKKKEPQETDEEPITPSKKRKITEVIDEEETKKKKKTSTLTIVQKEKDSKSKESKKKSQSPKVETKSSEKTPKSIKDSTPEKTSKKVKNENSTPEKTLKKEKTPTKEIKKKSKDEKKTPEKKLKIENEEEPIEDESTKKKKLATRNFLSGRRPTALNPGSKEIPIAKDECLSGKAFIISGVLESLERNEIEELIKRYGGIIKTSMSKKVDFFIVGEEPGETKMKKAKQLNTKQLSEDDFLQILRDSSVKMEMEMDSDEDAMDIQTPEKKIKTPEKKEKVEILPVKRDNDGKNDTQLWTDKYAPSSFGDIVGNTSNIKLIGDWLKNWKSEYKKNLNVKKPTWKKALIISGKPGIGKTSSTKIICKNLGYTVIEMNASDARNKKAIQNKITEMTTNQSFIKNEHTCLVMDEVDGMSTGDRGGVTELIQIIKLSKIPIICICNDRYKQSLKSLINYCVDVKFRNPTVDQIFKRISNICKIEKIPIQDAAIRKLIESSNQDLRFILNHLQMMNKLNRKITFDDANDISNDSTPDNIFQITTKFLNIQERPKSYQELIGLYFDDPQLVPLMIQQNYLNYQSNQLNPIESIVKASESISFGDTINIMKTQDYSLSTLHAFYSTIQSSAFVSGRYVRHGPQDNYYPQFPSFLGKSSTQRKNYGILNSIFQSSLNLTSGTNEDFRDNYLPLLNNKILDPLKEKEGVDLAIERMDEYHISKDDVVAMNDILSMGEKLKNKFNGVPSKVKSHLTKTFNKTHHQISRSSSRRKKDDTEEEEEEE
eukprot:gene1958-1466_t